MAYTWQQFEATLRRTYLEDAIPDKDGNYKYSKALLMDCLNFALIELAQHTAIATATSYPATSVDYTLPDNLLTIDPFDQTGLVFITGPALTFPKYLDPVRYTPDSFYSGKGFYTHPEYSLHLTEAPDAGTTVNVEYFAYYNPIYTDTDVIQIPVWMRLSATYLAAAHAIGGLAVKSATIRQWGSKPDTGKPTDNVVQEQHQYLLRMYEAEIAKYPAQNRSALWRTTRPETR